MSDLPFVEATGGPVPKGEDEINLAGSGGIPDGDQIKSVIILCEKIAAGTMTADTVTDPITSADEAETIAGLGSPAACLARRFMEFSNNKVGRPKAKVRLACIDPETAGTAAVQVGTFTNTATGAGTWKTLVGRYALNFPVRLGDTPQVQSERAVEAFNNAEIGRKLPLVATSVINGAGPAYDLTLTATFKGDGANSIGLKTLAAGDPDVTTTLVWGGAYMGDAGGTPGASVDLAAELTAVLAAIRGNSDCAGLVTAWNADAALEAIIDEINARGNATNKIASYLYCANNSETTATMALARAAQITWSVGLDSDDAHRVNAGGVYGTGDWHGFQAVASAALRAAEPHLARSLNGLEDDGVPEPATADKYLEADLALLLEAGFTPWYVHEGKTKVGMCRHVMCRDSWGVKDFHKIQVPDLARQRLSYRYGLVERMSIVADSAPLPAAPHVTQPKFLIATGYMELKAMEREAFIDNVDELIEVAKSEHSGTEVRQAFALHPVDQLHNRMTRYDVDMT